MFSINTPFGVYTPTRVSQGASHGAQAFQAAQMAALAYPDRIGKRRATLGLSRGAGALALMVLCLGGLPAPGNADQQDSKQQAVELLASDTFMPMELREERRLKEQFRDDDGDSWWRDLLQRLIDGQRDNERGDPLALPEGLIHAIGWTLLVALLAVIAWALLRRLPGSPLRRSPTAMPVQVAGLDTRAENLPVDLAGALDDALRQGRIRDLHSGLDKTT